MSVYLSSIATIQMNRLNGHQQGALFKWRINGDRVNNTNNDGNN